MVAQAFVPDRGDIIWLSFSPQTGREQAGTRPALVLSPKSYNKKVGLGIFCPITSKEKGYPFEVVLPDHLSTKGVVLTDQIRSLDWRNRNAKFIEKCPASTLIEIQGLLELLIFE